MLPPILFLLNILITPIVILASANVAISAPDVFVLHSPIQPANSQQVSYSAKASDPTGVTSIVISEQQERLKLCPNGEHACSDIMSMWSDIQICNFNPPLVTAQCSVTINNPYPDNYRIGYRARATNMNAQTTTEGDIYFAAGEYNWPNDPIPIYVRGDPDLKIDLVFIPDTDYGTNNVGFMNDVTSLLRDGFLSEKPFAKEIRPGREMWNFYITYQQGHASEPCQRHLPSNWTTMRATVDSGFIVHKLTLRDCSGIGPGSTFSGEPINTTLPSSYVVPIHEAGHSVFSLADEYQGGLQFEGTLPEHNVFIDKLTCRANALNHGWPLANCKLIGKTSWWRSDDGSDVMEDTSSTNNVPGPSDAGRYHWWYGQCAAGNC